MSLIYELNNTDNFSLPEWELFNGCQYFTDFSFNAGHEAIDLTGNKATTNSVTYNEYNSGPGSQAIAPIFDGSSTAYSLDYATQFDLTEGLTLFAFIKRNGNNTSFRQIFSKQYASTAVSPFLDWMLSVKDNFVALRIGVTSINTTVPIPDGEWAHIVFISDGSEWRVYLNQKLEYQQALTRLPSNTNSIGPRIGHLSWGSPSEFFIGDIAQVGCWNRAIKPYEVSELYDYSWGIKSASETFILSDAPVSDGGGEGGGGSAIGAAVYHFNRD